MIKKHFLIFIGALLVSAIGQSAYAAKPVQPAPAKTPLGVDVSWPQCGTKLPTDHAFGIVGINDGLANTTNPCIKDQQLWAKKAVGGTKQERVQVYVNTANPGGLNTASWPKNTVDPTGALAPNPYQMCDGTDSMGCAWQYGWNRAVEDVVQRFTPAAQQTGLGAASQYVWWLDVETENTWKPATSKFNTDSNVAVIEGMQAYFASKSIRTGLYSTAYQWGQIVGSSVSSTSNLNGLPNWRPGGASLITAKEACSAAPLTAGGYVSLTQFVSRGIDYNYSCI